MPTTGVIGGSGFNEPERFEVLESVAVSTPFGAPSAPLQHGRFAGEEIVFLPRHGTGHRIPPHLINYRANLWALQARGVRQIIALAAVGGIGADCRAGVLVLPDQILDYTHGRASTFSDTDDVYHVDFTRPYCSELRDEIRAAASACSIDLVEQGTYAATQGPRFESAAEIRRLERDGATVVGMTGMPEAVLARELGLCYATIAVVVNAAAGKGATAITAEEIDGALARGSQAANELLAATLPRLPRMSFQPPIIVRA